MLRHRAVVARTPTRPLGEQPGSEESVLARERRQRVLAALQSLPRRQREVLALRYYAELSEAEIARTLGISAGAVKSHASRGAASLRRVLTEEDR